VNKKDSFPYARPYLLIKYNQEGEHEVSKKRVCTTERWVRCGINCHTIAFFLFYCFVSDKKQANEVDLTETLDLPVFLEE
jgi:hypothetical protein